MIADRTAYDVRYTILANYQTGFGYKFTNGWYVRRYDPIQRVFMNAPKLYLLKRDH